MFRILFSLALLFHVLLPADSGKSSGSKFLLREERNETARIRVDSSNIRVESYPAGMTFKRLPEGSFAEKVGIPPRRIRWEPAKDPDNISRTLIREISRSFDLSVIVIAEETGAKNGPFGTRLVLIDPLNLLVMNVLELPFRAREVRCQGSSGKVWCLRDPQPEELEDSPAAVILNAADGKVEKEIPLDSLPVRMFPHITGKFAWILENETVFRLFPDGKRVKEREVKGASDLKLTPDCMYYAVVSATGTSLYSCRRDEGEAVVKTELVPGNTILFSPGDPPGLILGTGPSGIYGLSWPEQVYLADDGAVRRIIDDLSGSMVLDISGKYCYAVLPGAKIGRFDFRSGKMEGSVNFHSLKPVKPGNVLMLFPLAEPSRFLILDTVGGFSKVDAVTKRWKKVGSMRPWTER